MRRAIVITLALALTGVICVAGRDLEYNEPENPCMPPKGGEICSGHGECHMGKCRCQVTEEGHYTGRYCQTCPTCTGRCLELKACVQCWAYHTGPLKNDCYDNCDKVVGPQIGVSDEIIRYESRNEQLCTFYDEDDCKFAFKYSENDDDKLFVEVQSKRECPGYSASFWDKTTEKTRQFFSREIPEYWENFKAEMRQFLS